MENGTMVANAVIGTDGKGEQHAATAKSQNPSGNASGKAKANELRKLVERPTDEILTMCSIDRLQHEKMWEQFKPVMTAANVVFGAFLGNGAFGEVRKGYQVDKQRVVAIKYISFRKVTAAYLDKFLPRECGTLKQLFHPYVVRFYKEITGHKHIYLITEFVEGGDILQEVTDRGRISPEVARKWFSQIVDALVYCHRKSVAHRDLKCENIMLDCNKNVKVADFGFARYTCDQNTRETQYSDTFCGSQAYAAPEVLRAEDKYDALLADVWSIGIIYYMMLSGKLPFPENESYDEALRHAFEFLEGTGRMKYDCAYFSAPVRSLLEKIFVAPEERLNIKQVAADPAIFDEYKKWHFNREKNAIGDPSDLKSVLELN